MSTKPMFDEKSAKQEWLKREASGKFFGFVDGARWSFTRLFAELEKKDAIIDEMGRNCTSLGLVYESRMGEVERQLEAERMEIQRLNALVVIAVSENQRDASAIEVQRANNEVLKQSGKDLANETHDKIQKLRIQNEKLRDALREIQSVTGRSTLQWKIAHNGLKE